MVAGSQFQGGDYGGHESSIFLEGWMILRDLSPSTIHGWANFVSKAMGHALEFENTDESRIRLAEE